jgi:uncharacterized protein YndB with AHSA1/START domain
LPDESNNKIVIRRLIPASREEVFAAWTDAPGMAQWMCPGTATRAEAQLDVRVGGSFRIVMTAPTEDLEHTGEYRVVDPPSKLVFTWFSKGTDFQETLVTVELYDRNGGCELVLTHEGIPRPDSAERHRAGWTRIAELLESFLSRAKTGRARA